VPGRRAEAGADLEHVPGEVRAQERPEVALPVLRPGEELELLAEVTLGVRRRGQG
jgi:hypothetical protein